MIRRENKILALADCNNFYASCERVFRPELNNRPVIVLSNNDGCVIARSDEAKAIGIKMGNPVFEMADLIGKYEVAVFSANFALYGDMSQRVMNTLAQFTPDMEIYSIDEAFLDFTSFDNNRLTNYAKEIRNTVKQWTGIPVSIGIGSTKTLAKTANQIVKMNREMDGVLNLCGRSDMDELLSAFPIEEVWGIGRQFAKILKAKGIRSALDFRNADEKWVLGHFHVPGHRTLLELRGISCIKFENTEPGRKGICVGRSFGKPLTEYNDIEQAVTTFASRCSAKLRRQKSVTRILTVFIMTNRFANTPQYVNGKTIKLPVATNNANEIIHHSVSALRQLYRKGYKYKKAGVILTDFVPENSHQVNLWDNVDRKKFSVLMKTIDKINFSQGTDIVKFAIQGTQKNWKMKQEKLSPCYTTRWNDLLTIDLNDQ